MADAGDGEVLVRVLACGLNNTDVNTRKGWYSRSGPRPVAWDGSQLTLPRIQGADIAGTVVEAGRGVDNPQPGQRVLIDPWLRDWDDPHNPDKCGYLGSERDGGFADYVVADCRNVHTVETDLSAMELTTFATSCVTAENMLDRVRVASGDTELVTGASGGVGSALIQLANCRGARTVAMCSSDKREPVGAVAGPRVEMDLRDLYLCDLTFTGVTVTPPGVFADLVRYIEAGDIRPLLAAAYPLERLREAQQAFIDKRHVGNIVVSTRSDR